MLSSIFKFHFDVFVQKKQGISDLKYLFRISWQPFVGSDGTEWQSREKPSSRLIQTEPLLSQIVKTQQQWTWWAANLTCCHFITGDTWIYFFGVSNRELCACVKFFRGTLCHLSLAPLAACLISHCNSRHILPLVSEMIRIERCLYFVACDINT